MSGKSLPLAPYAGPLDLLLDEVRRQNIDLDAVALAPLVARYLDYLQRAVRKGRKAELDKQKVMFDEKSTYLDL